jgi:hypothetical protein
MAVIKHLSFLMLTCPNNPAPLNGAGKGVRRYFLLFPLQLFYMCLKLIAFEIERKFGG